MDTVKGAESEGGGGRCQTYKITGLHWGTNLTMYVKSHLATKKTSVDAVRSRDGGERREIRNGVFLQNPGTNHD